MDRGSGHKYRMNWTNLSEEQICKYGANHRHFQDPTKELPQKVPKTHGPQRLLLNAEGSSLPVSNKADALKFYPSSGKKSEAWDDDQQFQGISLNSLLQIGDNALRMEPSFKCLDQRVPGLIASHIAFIAFLEYIRA